MAHQRTVHGHNVMEIPFVKRLLVGFVIMMSVFGFLAWRSEVNARGIRANTHRVAVAQYVTCQRNRQSVIVYDRFQRAMIKVEALGPASDARRTTARVAVYRRSILPVYGCGKKP
jgi:hypothetical protein